MERPRRNQDKTELEQLKAEIVLEHKHTEVSEQLFMLQQKHKEISERVQAILMETVNLAMGGKKSLE